MARQGGARKEEDGTGCFAILKPGPTLLKMLDSNWRDPPASVLEYRCEPTHPAKSMFLMEIGYLQIS